jgi:hypothetical protein
MLRSRIFFAMAHSRVPLFEEFSKNNVLREV